MSTKNIVDANVVPLRVAIWHFVSTPVVRLSGILKAGIMTPELSCSRLLSRLSTSLFTEYEASPALMPVPVRNVNGRNGSWR